MPVFQDVLKAHGPERPTRPTELHPGEARETQGGSDREMKKDSGLSQNPQRGPMKFVGKHSKSTEVSLYFERRNLVETTEAGCEALPCIVRIKEAFADSLLGEGKRLVLGTCTYLLHIHTLCIHLKHNTKALSVSFAH